jgi:RecA/RadA recombinase
MAKNKDKKEEEIITSEKIAGAFFEANSADHLGNVETAEEYKVSMGSNILDREMDGGLSAGLHRFIGINEGGKTSQALLVMKNFLAPVKDRRGILIKAEGRLSKQMVARSGITFVTDPKDWKDGTCLVFECNVFETVNDFMRTMVTNNPQRKKYCILLDSVDGLIPKGDLIKNEGDATKVAGGALLTSTLLKRINKRMTKEGHLAIFISQVRSEVVIEQKGKREIRQGSASGGNALKHYADWVIEFEPRFGGDLIMPDPEAKPDPIKNPIWGHWAKIKILKSPNEKTGLTFRYPIKYGRVGGNSIWVEYEVGSILISHEYYTRKGGWYSIDPDFADELTKAGLTFKEKIQGELNVYNHLEENQALTKYLKDKFAQEVGEA